MVAVVGSAISFFFGYGVGLAVEWFVGKDVVLGPLGLPTWMGLAFIVLGGIGRAASSD